jgi:two-component system KDP operon response regulator KdpE
MQRGAHAGKHILVVEDDTAIGEMLQMLLEIEGYRVTLAPLAQQAYDLLAAAAASPAARIDAVLLDLQLPDMDGAQIMQPFQERGQPRPPVIVVSARPRLAVESAALELHAASFLHKPFQIPESAGAARRGALRVNRR